MTKTEIQEIAKAVVEAIKETQPPFYIDRESHYQDHLAVQRWRKNEVEEDGERRRLRDKIIGAVSIAAIGGFLAFVGHAVIEFIRGIK